MRIIKLMTEYGCFPIWNCDGIGKYNLSPEDLPISENLKQALQEWADIYDRILDWDDPASASFKSKEEEENFEKRGLELWNRLKNELGDEYTVHYFSEIEGEQIE